MVAIELQDPTLATSVFTNATGNGQDGWKALSYADLSDAMDKGVAMQSDFANINTDNPDLSGLKASGGKLLAYHGLADELIAPQGSLHYYENVMSEMGGKDSTQEFYRLFMVPAMGHGLRNGTTNADANPPLPTGLSEEGGSSLFFKALVDWVENGIAPEEFVIANSDDSATALLCAYPAKPVYQSDDAKSADNYSCQ